MFMRVMRHLILGMLGSLLVVVGACASTHPIGSAFDASFDDAGGDTSMPLDDSAPSGEGGGGFVIPDGPSADSPIVVCTADACAALCGNGIIDPGEGCDDGNSTLGDGCSDHCQIEPGYACPTAGQPCVQVWICGNGKLDPGEGCDDGNMNSSDGCSATCQVESGWHCPTLGAPCIADSVCGDGILAGTEQCDDGNTTAGDGCSATCQIEAGYVCAASTTSTDAGAAGDAAPPPASTCHKTVCGDGKKEGAEQCDDGNLIPYDGCSPTCTIEVSCNGTGGCTGVCGDGLVFPGEACDDGNTISGDGCSSTCQIEPGFTCTKAPQPPQSELVIPILYRDMLYHNPPGSNATTVLPTPAPIAGGHPDFNCGPGHCAPGGAASTGEVGALLTRALGADGKPVFASVGNPQTLTDPVSFCWWYHDTGCVDGGANPYAKLVYLDALGKPTTLTLTAAGSGTYTSTNPHFFPIDGLGWNAGTNPQTDLECGTTSPPHNFSFTSELHYVFTYDGTVAASATPAVFNFTGDDDVWGFINNYLVIDLGGVHGPTPKSFTLDTANAAAIGLVAGGWYSIDLFHAEAHVCQSTYALTLGGFVHTISQCHSTCGDGIAAGGEKCDNGANNVPAASAYGPSVCTADCVPAPSCGDGVVQTQFGEQCDNGTNLAIYGALNPMICGPGCKWAPYCGDGIVQPQFGEQCDGTPNCSPMCLKTGAM